MPANSKLKLGVGKGELPSYMAAEKNKIASAYKEKKKSNEALTVSFRTSNSNLFCFEFVLVKEKQNTVFGQ